MKQNNNNDGDTVQETAGPGETILDVRNVVRHFPVTRGVFKRTTTAVKAVDGVSLTLHKGETLGLVGESGCGKSTLAKLLMALDRPTSGEVLLDGQNLFNLSRGDLRRMRRRIQIVMQDPYASLNPRMTVGEIVAEPFEIHTEVLDRSKRKAAVKDLLDVVGLNPDHLNRYPHQFSGGQRQRIGIARALALKPEVIICDEPVSALDVSVQAQVINLLANLQQEFNLSYIFISHDLSIVRHVSDRVAVMYLGKIVERGTEDDIYSHSSHPYTQALISAVAAPDVPQHGTRERIVLSGEIPGAASKPTGCAFRTRCWKAQDICAEQVPALVVRPGSPHPSACHFAGELTPATIHELALDGQQGTFDK